MLNKFFIFLVCIIFFYSCAKDEKVKSIPDPKDQSIQIYRDALNSLESGDIFFAAKNFPKPS